MKIRSISTAAVFAAIAIALTGCGSEDSASTSDAASGSGSQVDAMFVTGMVPHHQAAIDMAELGETDAKHDEIKQLSANIIKSQQAEIEQMNAMKADLPAAKGSMMSQDEMTAMMSDVDALKEADDFDKAFIDAMIPHHQAAVVMANQVIAEGNDPEVVKLAKSIVKAQSKEIADMQSWRVEWYGKPLPNEESSSMGSMHSH